MNKTKIFHYEAIWLFPGTQFNIVVFLLLAPIWLFTMTLCCCCNAGGKCRNCACVKAKWQSVNCLPLRKGCFSNINLLSASQMPDTAFVAPVPSTYTRQPFQPKLHCVNHAIAHDSLSATEAHPMSTSTLAPALHFQSHDILTITTRTDAISVQTPGPFCPQ